MSRFVQPALIWWQDRAPRERLLLGLLAGIVALWLAVVAVWQPLQAAQARLGAQILRHDRALSVVQSRGVTAAPQVAPDDRPLPVVITETAANFGLTIRRLEPEGPRVRVVLDEAAFDAVILWLEAVQRDQGVRVVDLALTRRPAPGIVNATLALER